MLPGNAIAQSVDPEPPAAAAAVDKVQVWLTTYDTSKKLQKQADLTWSGTQPTADFNVPVDESIKYQQMDGFGATITDPAIWKADPAVREEIMRLLFSRNSGIGLNMVRVGMRTKSPSGVDTTYNDVPRGETDPTLSKFSIAYDLEWKIPMMQRAKELNPELTLMGTPWSAPAWMKDSGAAGYGKLLPQYYSTYSDYFVKFIQGWRDNGLGISAVTMQNEPHFEPYGYPGMRMEPADQIALALQMGPAFQTAGLSTRIICWDHNFDEYTYPIEVLDDINARQWIDGSAFHAYAGDPNNMSFVKAAHPDKNLYFTEQTGSYPGDGFGSSINWHVKNLFMIPGWNYSRCTLLWQLALASTNLAGDRPFVRVAADGKSYELFGEYYETGHFSKFVRKGAYRIEAATAADGKPRTIAYQNPDGSKVLVALNDTSTTASVSIQDNGRWISYPLAGGSLATFTWRDTVDGNGLAATYFDNPDLTGVTESRIDPTVDFNWGAGTPDTAIGYAGFSARWTGTVKPQYSELYTFHANTSDGVRLWVNNQLVIDNWLNQAATETSGSILLTADQAADIRMEYYSVSGTSVAKLAWSSASTPKQTIPRSRLYAPAVSTVPPPPLQLIARAPAGTISLAWNAAPTATSYTVKRSTTKGGPYTLLASGLTATSYTDSPVSAGTTYHYVISASNATGTGADSAPASATPSTALPSPWTSQDIGSVNSTGNAGAVGASIKLTSAGNDIWGTADSFHFTYVPMTGDGTIIARVATQESTHEWAKAGVMMRESLASNSAHASLVLSPRHGAALFTRVSAGAATTSTNIDGPFAPHWVKLVRSGSTFTGYSSPDGITWTQVGVPTSIAMVNAIYVGLANASHVATTNISTFDSISSPGLPVPLPLAPAGLVATVGNGSIGLSWKAVANATSYNIKRTTTSGGPYATIGTATTPVYIDGTALNDTVYYYIITAVNPSGQSVNSGEVSGTPSSLLLPPGWVDQDIGAVGFTGGASYAAGTFSIKGSGSDIWGTTDGFNYCYQTVSGDGAIVARVTSVQNTSSYAKASVMFRESTLANAAHVSMQVNPNGSVDFTYRTSAGGSSANAGWTSSGTPKWIKLVRSGTSFSGYYSSNGTTWTQLGTAMTIPLSSDMLAGMAVSAVNNSALNTSTLDNVALTGFGSPVTPTGLAASQLLGGINLQWNATNLTASYVIKRATVSGGPYTTIATSPVNSFVDLTVANRTTYYYVISALNALGESGNSGQASAKSNSLPLPTGWLDKDIGSVGLPGNADYENGAFTVRGSGTDIWGIADAFNFCYRPVSGNSSITARVTSVQNTSSTAKAGLMFRDSTTATAGRYAMISVSPGAGIKFEYRTNNNGTATSAGTASGSAPVYLRLTRTSNSFSAFYSSDGTAWTQLGSAVTISRMASSAYEGFAVCAANNTALNAATFNQITAFNYAPPATPQDLTAAAGNSEVTLNWSTVAGATSYYVKRATSSGGPYATMANPTGVSYTDSQAFNGSTYYYVVSALTAGAESANSVQASAALQLPTAPAPTGLTATATGTQISLIWTASSGAANYNIKRSTTPGGPYTSVGNSLTPSYTNTDLVNGTTYYYVVSAVNAAGESVDSTQVAATPQAATPSTWVGVGTSGAPADWSTFGNWTGTVPTNNYTIAGLTFSNTANSFSNNDLTGLTITGISMPSTLPTRDNTITGNKFTLSGDVTVSTGSWQSISTDIGLTGNRKFTVSSGQLTLGGALTDGPSAGGILKEGGATLILKGAGSMTGVTTQTVTTGTPGGGSYTVPLVFNAGSAGTVVLQNTAALGAASLKGIQFNSSGGGTLDLQTDTSVNSYSIFAGSGATANTIIANRLNNGTGITHNLGVAQLGSAILTINQGGKVTSGTGGVSFSAVSFTGGNNDRVVTLNGTAAISIGNVATTANTANSRRLGLAGTNANNAVTGVIANLATGVTGASVLSLVKSDTSTWTLFGNNSYTGTTSIDGGTLVINGNQSTASGIVTVGDDNATNGTATLGGTGTVGGAIIVRSDGILAPGVTLGTFTAASSVTLNGRLAIGIDGVSADRLTVAGNLNITAATLDITPLAGGATGNDYVIASFDSLTGTAFAAITGLPPGFTISYDLTNKQIKLVKPASYESWIGGYTVSDPAATADPDADGLANIIEYVLGGDPSRSSSNLSPTLNYTTQELTYTFPRRDASETANLTLTVEAGSDLISWPETFNIGADSASSSPGVVIAENGTGADIITVTIPVATSTRKFVRLKVILGP